jgi:hypothetical protein
MKIKTKKPKKFAGNKIQSQIYAYALKNNLSYEDVEAMIMKEAGLTQTIMTRYTNNTSQPGLDIISIIAQVLDCQIDELIQLQEK